MTVFMLIEVITCQFGFGFGADGGLNMNYYLMSCPFVEPVVKNIVNRALDNDPTLAAALIRMHFHDCFIQVLLSLSLDTIAYYSYTWHHIIMLHAQSDLIVGAPTDLKQSSNTMLRMGDLV